MALEDRSFTAVAIERFGGRVVPWIEQERSRPADRNGTRARYVDKIAPRSGAHRGIIAAEFDAAVHALVATHAPYATTTSRSPAASAPPLPPVTAAETSLIALIAADAPKPQVDPDFLDEAGHLRPMSEISAILLERACEARSHG